MEGSWAWMGGGDGGADAEMLEQLCGCKSTGSAVCLRGLTEEVCRFRGLRTIVRRG